MNVGNVSKAVVSTKLDPQVVEAMRKVRKAMYPISLLHIAESRELVDEH